MALDAKYVSFAKSTGGAPASQSITTVGFQGKAAIFWGNSKVADGSGTPGRLSIGIAASSSQRFAQGFGSQNGVNPSETSRKYMNTRGIGVFSSFNENFDAEADFVNFTSNGFDLTWNPNDANANIINALVLGGSDITNVFAGEFTLPTGAVPVSKDITTVGFSPDFIFFIPTTYEVAAPNADNRSRQSLGLSVGTTQIAGISAGALNTVNPTSTRRYQRTDRVVGVVGDSTIKDEFTVTAILSNGFTVNLLTSSAGTADYVYFLAIKGGQHKVGSFTQPTAGTPPFDQDYAGIGFTPKGLFLASACAVASSSVSTNSRLSIGCGTDVSSRGVIWHGDRDAVTPSNAGMYLDRTKVYKAMTEGTPTLDSDADLASTPFSNGKFTLSWTSIDATPREVLYWAFGDAGAAPPPDMYRKRILVPRPWSPGLYA